MITSFQFVLYILHYVCVAIKVIEYGGGVRSTGATGVNADSSRSHAILQLEVKVVNTEDHVGRYLAFKS